MSGGGGQAVGGDERVQAVYSMLQNNPSLQRFQMFQPQSQQGMQGQAQSPIASSMTGQSGVGWRQQPTNDLAPMQQFQQAKASPQSFAPLQNGAAQGATPAAGGK